MLDFPKIEKKPSKSNQWTCERFYEKLDEQHQ